MKAAGAIACICAVVFAIPHFWFYYGASLAYPGDFMTSLSGDGVLLFVGGFALVAAIYALAFTRLSFVRRLPELIITLPAWFGAIGFTVWGLAYFGLQVQLAVQQSYSSAQYYASTTNPSAIWGLYWYSLFILWGLSLGTAAFYYHKRKNAPVRADGR
jgi:hypothetical protein